MQRLVSYLEEPGTVFWPLLVVIQSPAVGECLKAVAALIPGGVLHHVLGEVLLLRIGLKADVTTK